MLIVLTHSHKDRDLALKQAKWIAELGEQRNHRCLVACNKMAEHGLPEFVTILTPIFRSVETFVPFDENESGWPGSPTHMFKRVAQEICWNQRDIPFLWIEADAVLLKKDGFDIIQAEYERAGKPFMGNLVNLPPVPLHMTGIGVYHSVPNLLQNYAIVAGAWDNDLGDSILPQAHITNLIQHEWKPDPDKVRSLVKPETVIFHQDKEGRLYQQLLNEKHGVKGLDVGEVFPFEQKAPALFELKSPEPVSDSAAIRQHCAAIQKLVGESRGKKGVLHEELRKLELLGPAKQRLRKSNANG